MIDECRAASHPSDANVDRTLLDNADAFNQGRLHWRSLPVVLAPPMAAFQLWWLTTTALPYMSQVGRSARQMGF